MTDAYNKYILNGNPLVEEIKNAVPVDIAYTVRNMFLDADYDLIKQSRRHKFRLEHDSKYQALPDETEVFSAEFHRSRFLETSEPIKNVYDLYIRPLVEKQSGRKFEQADLRCYKMIAGGHFRIHKDDYQSQFGFIWYLTENWKWDWGGLLITLQPGLDVTVHIPEFNKLVIMNHAEEQLPHFVSEVSIYAKEPRLMLVGFLQ